MATTPTRRLPSLARVLAAPRGRTRRVLTVLAWLLVVVAVVGLVSQVRGGGSPFTIFLTAVAPYLLLASVPALVLFLLGRHWPGVVVAGLLLAALVVSSAPLYGSTDPPADARDVVVMTANLKLGQADPHELVDAVRRHDVDLLMLEELTPREQDLLVAAGLDALLPHHESAPAPLAAGTGLWSRYPLTRLPAPELSFHLVITRAEIPGVAAAPTVVALHVGGPLPDATNWREDLRRLPGILAGLSGDAPVLVGGDFNATPSFSQFRALLEHGYRDAGEQAGAGFVRTFPANNTLPPLLGIDHVLTRDAVGRDVKTVEISGTDHRALVATVAVPRTS